MKNVDLKICSAIFGVALEHYDMMLFAIFATTISSYYFPDDSTSFSTYIGLALFAISYIVRPIGAICFGFIGDLYGRKTALTACLVSMSVADEWPWRD